MFTPISLSYVNLGYVVYFAIGRHVLVVETSGILILYFKLSLQVIHCSYASREQGKHLVLLKAAFCYVSITNLLRYWSACLVMETTRVRS